MLPIPNHDLFVLYCVLAFFGSVAAIVAAGIWITGTISGTHRHAYSKTAHIWFGVLSLLFVAGIAFWDYLVITDGREFGAREAQVEQSIALLENPATPAEAVIAAAAAPDKRIRARVAAHPATDAETLIALAGDTSAGVRSAVAERADAPDAALLLLSKDTNAHTRAVVAARSDVSPAVLGVLAVDTDDEVAAAALANPSTPSSALAAALNRSLQQLGFDQDTSSGVSDAGLRVAAAAHPSAGAVTLRMLAADPEPSVRSAVAARSDAPGDVLAALAQDPDPSVRSAAEMNPSTPAGLSSAGAAESPPAR